MTVKAHIKTQRRRILVEHITREYARTGRNAFEQYQHRVRDLAPVHEKINQRAEDEVSRRLHAEFWRKHREKATPGVNWTGHTDIDLARDVASIPRNPPAT